MNESLYDAALWYQDKGFKIFPLAGRSKVPLTSNGFKSATNDRSQIIKWWTKYPNANIGLVTGQENSLIVIDCDINTDTGEKGYSNLREWLGSRNIDLPTTLCTGTGKGGIHIFYRITKPVKSRIGFLSLVDIKADGGYVVAPPSIHPNGKRYEWLNESEEIAFLPDSLYNALNQYTKSIDLKNSSMSCKPKIEHVGKGNLKITYFSIPEGQRNNTLTSIAGEMRQYGFSTKSIQEELSCRNIYQCAPSLSQNEVENIVRSVCRYPLNDKPNDKKNNNWSEVVPLNTETLPTFPIDALTPILKDYVIAEAQSTQTSIDMAATVVLGCIAICVQNKARIAGKPDWIEPLNLYVMIVALPAERKSAVLNKATFPIYEYEREKAVADRPKIEANRIEREIKEKEINKLKNDAAKDGDPSIMKQALAKNEELSRMPELKPFRIISDDVTPEKLISLLADNGGSMANISSEGGIFSMMSGKYSKEINIDVFLKAHSGDPIRVDRVGRPAEYVNRPCLSMLLTVQPDVLEGLIKNGTFRGRGLTARFLYCIPQSTVGRRKFDGGAIPQIINDKYENHLKTLLSYRPPDADTVITLEPSAQEALKNFFEEIEPLLLTEYEGFSDWAGKLNGAVLRIAGVLHCSQHSNDYASHAVTAETMNNAIAIGRYYLEHAKAAYKLMGNSSEEDNALYILKTIKNNSFHEFTFRDIQRKCRRYQRKEEIIPYINLLMEYGYIRQKEENLFEVNPIVFEGRCHI